MSKKAGPELPKYRCPDLSCVPLPGLKDVAETSIAVLMNRWRLITEDPCVDVGSRFTVSGAPFCFRLVQVFGSECFVGPRPVAKSQLARISRFGPLSKDYKGPNQV